jgi:sugar phosphate isomerase/epimerase
MAEMLAYVDSPFLQMTMDTGNVFISGQDPVKFLARFLNRVGHVHIKDVAPRLSETGRGKQTGIGMSHCPIGEGVNAQNIRGCLELLRDQGFRGAVSLECEAQGGPVMERSILWIRGVLKDLNLAHDLDS